MERGVPKLNKRNGNVYTNTVLILINTPALIKISSSIPELKCYIDRLTLVVIVVLLFYVHDKHLRSCRDGQLT